MTDEPRGRLFSLRDKWMVDAEQMRQVRSRRDLLNDLGVDEDYPIDLDDEND